MSDLTPLIFVPGFMASNLWRPAAYPLTLPLVVWPPTFYNLTSQLTALEEIYPLETQGLVDGYYQELLNFILRASSENGLGHVLNENFWIFTYDWRQSNRISGQQLQKFVLEKLNASNVTRAAQGLVPWNEVNIICHSMGGLVTRVAFSKYAVPIRRVIYLASGDYGTPKTFFALHPETATKVVDEFVSAYVSSWYWDLLKNLPNVWLLQNWLARVLTTFPAMYEMLPDKFYFDRTHGLIINSQNQLVTNLEATYFSNPWQLLPEQQDRARQAFRFKENLGQNLPGENNLLIYCDNLATYSHAHYGNRLQYPQTTPTGDGTVQAQSINRDERAIRITLEATHSQLPDLPATHQNIAAFLH